MSYFAEIDNNNIVQRVISAEQEFINSGAVGEAGKWIQTSYNTRGGIHYAPNSDTPDSGVALRKNYAGKGYIYDPSKDAFIPPKQYPSMVLNEETCQWDYPVAMPDDDKIYNWDEENTEWKEKE